MEQSLIFYNMNLNQIQSLIFMFSTLTRVSNYSIRSSKNKIKQLDLQKLVKTRQKLMNQLPAFYSTSVRQHEDNVYQQKLYGRKCYIVGMTPDSEHSATYYKSVFERLNPGLIILGGFNNSKILSLKLTDSIQQKRLIRGYDNFIQPSKLFCKKLITPMITRILSESQNYIVNQKNEVVYHIDHTNKHIYSCNYLTILNRVMFKQFSKLSFGLPSNYFLIEDLMIQQSIEGLREIYNKIIDKVKLNKNKYGQSQNTGKFYPDIIRQQMKFHALSQPSLNKKQISFLAALLNKSVTSIDKVVLFVANQHVHQIAQNVHKISMDPQQIYRGGFKTNMNQYIKNVSNSQTGIKLYKYLNAQNKSEVINQLIQKLVILNDLKDNALQIQLLQNQQNIFSRMVFAPIFSEFSIQDIKSRYRKYRDLYNLKIGQIVQARVLNVVHYKQYRKDFYTLTQMLKTQQQRIQDFPIKLQIQNKQTQKQNKRDLAQIFYQIKKIAKNQLEPSQKQLIDMYLSGKSTKQSLILFHKLFVKAKIKLKKSNIKLPIHHFGALSAIFKDQIKQSMIGQAHKVKNQNFRQKLQSLKQKGIVKQLTPEQFQDLQNSNFQRLSLEMNQKGQGNLIPDGQTVQEFQKLAENIKDDGMLRDLLGMQRNLKDGSEHYYEQQQQNQKNNKQIQEKRSKKGRKVN